MLTGQFERMSFDLQGAPDEFQNLINLLFKELKSQGIVDLYVNGIIIPDESWSHLKGRLRISRSTRYAMQKLRKSHLSVYLEISN